MDILKLIGRKNPLFDSDILAQNNELCEIISESRFLVIGGAGSIGQAVSQEIFKRKPRALHVVDISENNLVELVRGIRSSLGYIDGDFRTFAIDCGGREYEALMKSMPKYDYVLNLSALKHVRSEKDPFTLMRLIDVNILNTIKTAKIASDQGANKYFCVSTDKAANPANMMGASKLIMEMFMMRESAFIPVSTARFANVAFSDGSLLQGFNTRFSKQQPISAPTDVFRYFITPQESGELCLMSCLLGNNRDILFPKASEEMQLTSFSEIAERFIKNLGYEPVKCATEEEARKQCESLITSKRWPCYFFNSDTTGEKSFEEFFTDTEILDMKRFQSVGVIKNGSIYDVEKLDSFLKDLSYLRSREIWNKEAIIELFNSILPNFNHIETGKYLDGKM
jgi:FlaA1/EpsC-like NDP-sugar epimerase